MSGLARADRIPLGSRAGRFPKPALVVVAATAGLALH